MLQTDEGKSFQALTVEVDSADNSNLHFFPLGRTLRGRVDFSRILGREISTLRDKFRQPIPGMVITFDGKTASLIDPLHDAEHATTKSLLIKEGYVLGPARQDFDAVDSATWSHWLRRAIEDGLVRIVSGHVPKVEGQPKLVRRVEHTREDVIDKLLNIVRGLLPADKLQAAGL